MTEQGSPTGEELEGEPTVLELLGFRNPTPLVEQRPAAFCPLLLAPLLFPFLGVKSRVRG